ncbi:MAG TPA: type IV pilus modification protein PilV [Methylothermaceae bacterium]|nr:type IV pilus modification protein PilV [Methylothermaceae bacterium]
MNKISFFTRYQSGFTLVEILVSVLVLGIGLLGLAGLQTTGLKSNHSANLRTQATLLAYDMADRIRANKAGVDGGFYDKPTATDKGCVWDGNTPNNCTAQELAQHDAQEWLDTLARELPQGTGIVCKDSTPDDGGDDDNDGAIDITDDDEIDCDGGNLYTVKIWWVDEFDDDGDPIIKRFSTTFQP